MVARLRNEILAGGAGAAAPTALSDEWLSFLVAEADVLFGGVHGNYFSLVMIVTQCFDSAAPDDSDLHQRVKAYAGELVTERARRLAALQLTAAFGDKTTK